MKDEQIRYYWLGFLVAVVGIGWLLWLYRKQREVTPKPLHIAGRTAAYPMEDKASVSEPSAPDDLESIQGIGPAYAQRLNEAGIATFAQLADSDPDVLREITGVTRWNPNDWIAEANSRISTDRPDLS